MFSDGLKFVGDKCEFFVTYFNMLGCVADKGHLFTKFEKLQGLYNLKVPTTRTLVIRLYVLLSFFRRLFRILLLKVKC